MLVGDDRWHIYPLVFGAVSLAAEVLFRYKPYARLLKWLSFTVAGYIGIAFTVEIPWGTVLYHTIVPSITINSDYLLTLVAVLGTTISPYLFFWQSSQEVEEEIAAGEPPIRLAPRLARRQFERIRFDTVAGMVISNVVAYFIILTTATALFANGIHDIRTSMPPKRSSRSPDDSLRCCSLRASSAPGCSPCRCSRARPDTRSQKLCVGQ